jgi:hypothetical protein
VNNELLDEIKLAYEVHHLHPIRGFFFITRDYCDCACPLAALAIHRGILEGVKPGFEFDRGAIDAGAITVVDWSMNTFGQTWVVGFLDGFEGHAVQESDSKYLQGYDLGVEAAKQLFPEL